MEQHDNTQTKNLTKNRNTKETTNITKIESNMYIAHIYICPPLHHPPFPLTYPHIRTHSTHYGIRRTLLFFPFSKCHIFVTFQYAFHS